MNRTIKNIYGNKKDVIIQFEDNSFAASEWMSMSYPYTNQFLRENGYRKLNKEFLLNKNKDVD